MAKDIAAYMRMTNVTNVSRLSHGSLSLTYNWRILLAVVNHREGFRQPGFRIARSTLHTPMLMLLHISSRYRRSVLNSFRSTLDSCSVNCTGSNEESGCSLHVTSRFGYQENPRGAVVAQSSAWNRWSRGSSFVRRRHTSHCRGGSKFSSSCRIAPDVCPVF